MDKKPEQSVYEDIPMFSNMEEDVQYQGDSSFEVPGMVRFGSVRLFN